MSAGGSNGVTQTRGAVEEDPASDRLTARGRRAVPFVDLDRGHGSLAPELSAAFARVLESGDFVLGGEVEQFEEEFAGYCGAGHCVGVTSGTSALTLAISASGIRRGDEVIVPAHTYIASALAVVHAGAIPVFCDVEDATGLIDVESAAEAITERTAAIMAVHLYGQTCDMAPLEALARRHGLLLIEDAAQAHGATYRGRRAGTLGSVAAFSFYPSKNLGALGDGGAVLTGDPGVAQRVRELRNLGQRTKGDHVRAGLNARMGGVQAALLRVKLRHLDVWNAERRGHATTYRESLPGSVRLLEEQPDRVCVYHLFPIRSSDRDRVARGLASAGVGTGVHYSPALHEQPPLVPYAPPHPLPMAEAWAREELSLPMFPQLERAEVRRVARACAALAPAETEVDRHPSVA